MEYELPTNFDVIILGTGMVESIVSAAASRIGKTVLHIDSNKYYGGLFASFNLEAFLHINDKDSNKSEDCNTVVNENETFVKLGNTIYNLQNVLHSWNVPDKIDPVHTKTNIPEDKTDTTENSNNISDEVIPDNDFKDDTCKWSKESLLKESRKFNIDLTPKIQYARGEFIELLISSNIARYSEYRSVNRVLTWLNDHLEVVPCSRSDIFANNKVSVIEKRMMMKFLTSLDDNENLLTGYENKTYKTFLTDKKLSKNLIHYILYAISNSNDSTLCHHGVENTKKFLRSLGRFGKTPFLYSMFGSGDLTQEFCRLSAVFGSIYALGQPVHGITLEENKFTSLLVGKQRINAKHIVMGVDAAPENFVKDLKKKYISRGVFITDKTIMDSEQEPLTLLLYPPEADKNACTIVELPWLSSCCPKNTYLLHITCEQVTNPKDDLHHCLHNLFAVDEDFESSKPQILYSSYFSIPTAIDEDLRNILNVDNIFLCPGPDTDLDFDCAVKKAKEIFSVIYPEAEFLPRAPDPEEIKFEGENEENNDVDKMAEELEEAKIRDTKEDAENKSSKNNNSKEFDIN